jgi:hypothetical protein
MVKIQATVALPSKKAAGTRFDRYDSPSGHCGDKSLATTGNRTTIVGSEVMTAVSCEAA